MSPETDSTVTATTAPGLRPAPGRQQPLPEYVRTTDRNALPEVLNWGSEVERPPVLCTVDIIRFGIALGTGTVVGYFHHDGELGCWVDLDKPLDDGSARIHVYGESIFRLDLGDEGESTTATGVPAPAPARIELADLATPEPVLASAPADEDALLAIHTEEDDDLPFAS